MTEKLFTVIHCLISQTFDEIVDLAEKGNANNLQYTTADLPRTFMGLNEEQEKAGGMYTKFEPADVLVFCFSKAVGKELGEAVLHVLKIYIPLLLFDR